MLLARDWARATRWRYARAMMRWTVGIYACIAAACTVPPRTPTMSDGCKVAASRVARARALADAGWLDRAAARLREANASCPSDATARLLASTLGELGRTDELAAWITKLSATDPARGFVADALEHAGSTPVTELLASAQHERGAAARRLYDRALTRAELDARASSRTAIADPGSDPPLAASGNGRWVAIDNALVDTQSGQEIDHGGTPNVTFSPDERYVVYGDANATTVVVDLDSKTELVRIGGTPHNVVFDPGSHIVFVWTIIDGAEVRTIVDLARHAAGTDELVAPPAKEWVFDPHGKYVAWAGTAGPVVRELATRTLLKLPATPTTEVALGGDLLAFETGDDVVVVRLPAGTPVFRAKHVDSWVLAADGSRLAWSEPGGARQIVHARDLSKGRDIPITAKLGEGGVCGSGRYLWRDVTARALTGQRTCSLSDEITVDLGTGDATVVGHTPGDEINAQHSVYELCKRAGADCGHPEDQLVPPEWSGGTILPFTDGLATVDSTTGARRIHLEESADATADASGLVAGDHLTATDATGRTRIWDLATGKVIWRSRMHPERVAAAAFSDDELVTASPHATIRHWKLATGELIRTWTPAGCDVVALALAPRGEAVVACTYGEHLSVYREGTAAPLYTGPHPAHDDVALERSGQALALHTRDDAKGDQIVIVPLVEGGASRTFSVRLGEAAMSFAGDRLAIVNRELAEVWNVRTGEQRALALPPRTYASGTPALSQDGTSAAVRVGDHVLVYALSGSTTPLQLDVPPKIDVLWWVGGSRLVGTARVASDVSLYVALPATGSVTTTDGTPLAASNGLLAYGTARGLELRVAGDLAAVRTFTSVPGATESISIAAGESARITGTGSAIELAACMVGETRYPFEMCRGRFEP